MWETLESLWQTDQMRQDNSDMWGSPGALPAPADLWAQRHMPEAKHTSDFGLGHARTDDKLVPEQAQHARTSAAIVTGTVENKGGGM